MSEPAKKMATYEDLYSIPDNMTGEIIDGELIATPKPSRRHSNAALVLGVRIAPSYRFGEGGPGGWIILPEVEISFGDNILVPDISGWKRERFPIEEETNYITVPPDWICEVLSPGTFRNDKVKKMPIYARYQVEYLWLIDPAAMTLDAFKLELGRWVLLGSYAENDKVRVEPFPAIEINLDDLWLK